MGVLLKHFDVMLSVHADAVAMGTTVFVSALLFGLLYVPKPTNTWKSHASIIEHRRTFHHGRHRSDHKYKFCFWKHSRGTSMHDCLLSMCLMFPNFGTHLELTAYRVSTLAMSEDCIDLCVSSQSCTSRYSSYTWCV